MWICSKGKPPATDVASGRGGAHPVIGRQQNQPGARHPPGSWLQSRFSGRSKQFATGGCGNGAIKQQTSGKLNRCRSADPDIRGLAGTAVGI